MLFKNSRAIRDDYRSNLLAVLNIKTADESHAWLKSWSCMTSIATPRWHLPDLAKKLGVAALSVKDESKRSSLQSVEALGAPVGLVRLVMREFPGVGFTAQGLFSGAHADALKGFTVISATDGNHGLALAASAKSLGCRCVILIHRSVNEERRVAIENFGAQVIRINGSYSQSVQEAARMAERNAWHVVSDTSYEGFETTPWDVMQGYGAIAAELIASEGACPNAPSPFSHVVIQGGVGGLAAGVISYMTEYFGPRRPAFLIVEPERADCLYQSGLRSVDTQASGAADSLIDGLACRDVSPLAWRFLESTVDYFITIKDEQAINAMRILAKGSARDIPVVSGESGAAGLAAVLAIAASADDRARAGFNRSSRILVINTEGATAPALFNELVGCSPTDVLAAQTCW
jgi:diaminopropionate ammonia-lyase